MDKPLLLTKQYICTIIYIMSNRFFYTPSVKTICKKLWLLIIHNAITIVHTLNKNKS